MFVGRYCRYYRHTLTLYVLIWKAMTTYLLFRLEDLLVRSVKKKFFFWNMSYREWQKEINRTGKAYLKKGVSDEDYIHTNILTIAHFL